MPLSRLLRRLFGPAALSRRPNATPRPALESLEGRDVPTGTYGVGPSPSSYGLMGVSPVITYDSTTGAQKLAVTPYGEGGGFKGEVRVALGDVVGGGAPNIV